ncbi:MAG: hypothetical protein J0I12_23370 [Candidatus Eremiobacteraeota bacterium]|nr:hypothetical protein [Candidatus Eremiobacteraeota bacterium]
MIIVGNSSSKRNPALLQKARTMHQDLGALGSELSQLGDSSSGSFRFPERAIDSAAIQGNFSGQVEMENGQLKQFRLFDSTGRSAAYWMQDGSSGATAQDGSGLSISPSRNGEVTVTKSERVDPNTRSYRLKHSLKNCAAVAGSALATAVPVLGLGFFSMGQMFNDSSRDQPLQALTMGSHLLGAGALIMGAVVGDPTLLGLAGAGLGVSALAAGALEARGQGKGWTTPFQQSTMYSFPQEASQES